MEFTRSSTSRMARKVAELLAADNDDEPSTSGCNGRLKLKEKINLPNFLKSGELEFEVDEASRALDSFDLQERDIGFSDSENEEAEHENGEDKGNNNSRANPTADAASAPSPSTVLKNEGANALPFFTRHKMTNEPDPKFVEAQSRYGDPTQGWIYVTDDGGIMKKIDRPGNGKIPPMDAHVWINYLVYYANNPNKIIDSTRKDENGVKKNHPFSFRLFSRDVYAVLDYGVAKMEVKEKSRFLAKPEYAYGPLGIQGICEPNATVIFEVELLSFMDNSLGKDIGRMNPQELSQVGFREVLKAANQRKGDGNLAWQKGVYFRAMKNYGKAALILERYLTVDKNEDNERNELLFTLYLNMAQCEIEKKEWNTSLRYLNKIENLPPETKGNRCKLNYRAAKVYLNLNNTSMAKAKINLALELEPGNTSVVEFYEKITKIVSEQDKGTKEMYKRMGNGLLINDTKQ